MKLFLKINASSLLHALLFTVIAQLLLNVYRLNRVTNIEMSKLILWGTLSIVLLILICSVINIKVLQKSKWSYIGIFLWLPYACLFVYVFTKVFPMTNAFDVPPAAMGLILIGVSFLYFIYVALIILFVNRKQISL